MKIVISKEWMEATDKKERIFEVIDIEHNKIGAKGFDTFYIVQDGDHRWVVAACRVTDIIP